MKQTEVGIENKTASILEMNAQLLSVECVMNVEEEMEEDETGEESAEMVCAQHAELLVFQIQTGLGF